MHDVKAPRPIRALYAALTTPPGGGEEGICAVYIPEIGWTPVVFAERTRIEQFRPLIVGVMHKTGGKCRVVKFQAVEEIEEIGGSEV